MAIEIGESRNRQGMDAYWELVRSKVIRRGTCEYDLFNALNEQQ